MVEQIIENKAIADKTSPIENLVEHIEAILFLHGDGVEAKDLASKLEMVEAEIIDAMKILQRKYSGSCGIHLIKYRNMWQFSTNPIYANRVAEILNPIRTKNLTKAALETLAIIAYKQPITRIEIDDIRGVDSAYGVQILSQNNLIEVVGKKDTVGKPLLYATTDEFLKRFELESIDNLPSYEELLSKIKIIHQDDELYGMANRSGADGGNLPNA
ncbi:MAG: SMC-Scp complex subunit ScpB [Firmicutes bacterium]|nr:SMC-Scp complex subunit ScpB [Bacillota bacterium]